MHTYIFNSHSYFDQCDEQFLPDFLCDKQVTCIWNLKVFIIFFRFVAKDVPELDSALKSHILQDYEVDR